ncbi:MAG: response regulator [Nitrospirae bacterium]|nr:response regulator [Nitrospirota bacterium]
MEETRYCLCCGEQVRFNRIEQNERIHLTCIYCGFLLAFEDEPLTIERPPQKTSPDVSGCILVADDSKFTRKIIHDLLIEKQFASEVMTFENGLELTSAFAKLISEKKPIEIIVIDLNMPVMDGITSAKTLRAIEAQHTLQNIPIAFFSAVKADNNLRRQMDELAPASYVNKGTDPDPDKLAERVEHLISYLLQEKRKKQGGL